MATKQVSEFPQTTTSDEEDLLHLKTQFDVDNKLKIKDFLKSQNILKEYDTVSDMVNSSLGTDAVGRIVSTREFSTGSGGGGTYEVISGTGTANGYNIIAHGTNAISFVLRMTPKNINAISWGVTPNGVDSSGAMQNLIDSLGVYSAAWPVTAAGVSANAHKITLPYPNSGSYRFNTTINIPANIAVDIVSGAAWGSLIESTQDYAFNISASGSGSFRGVGILGLAFNACGISIEGNVRGNTRIEDNVFGDTPDYAIKGLGTSIVRGSILRNKFSACAGCVSFNFIDCDMWNIEQNDFTRSTEIDVLIGTTGVFVRDNDFETRATGSATKPWIKVTKSDNRIIYNRFGDETTTGYAPPRDAIQIGEDTPTSTLISDIIINHNTFRGTNGTPSATEADSCLRLNAPVGRIKFVSNIFTENSDYNTAVINENYLSALGNDARNSNNNTAFHNQTPSTFTVPFFSHGGVSFDSDRFGEIKKGPVGNLIRHTHDMTNVTYWLTTNTSIALDVVGPNGLSNTGHTLTKTAAGTAHIRSQLIGVANNVDGVINVKAQLKKGTLERARIYLVNTTDNITHQSNTTLYLTDEWKEYSVDFPNIDNSKTYFAYIAVGADNAVDSALTGTILVAEPMAKHSRYPTDFYLPNIHSGGTVHADLLYQGQMLGYNTVEYGTAAPVSGRYEVGDTVWNSAPAVGQPIGWKCTVAGSSGTWVAMVNL